MCVRQQWLHGDALFETTHDILVVCTGGVLPKHQLQPDTISPAHEALVTGWLTSTEEISAAGKICLNNTAMLTISLIAHIFADPTCC